MTSPPSLKRAFDSPVVAASAFLVSLAIGWISVFAFKQQNPSLQNHSLRHDVYIWQHHWTDEVTASVAIRANHFEELVLLAAEYFTIHGNLSVKEISFSEKALNQKKVWLAIRIGPQREQEALEIVRKHLHQLVRRKSIALVESGADLAGVQIDYDCPTSSLGSYALWLEQIRSGHPGLPFSATSLPAWLGSSSFSRFARAVDHFVLQVHSLEAPAHWNEAISLCSPAKALKWTKKADTFGAPFLVAVPTYSYGLVYDRSGKFLGAESEGPSASWPEGFKTRLLAADPGEMSKLRTDLEQTKLKNLKGIIWFRLPVDSDRNNWEWSTLVAVMNKSFAPVEAGYLVNEASPGLFQLVLTNAQSHQVAVPKKIFVSHGKGQIVAMDGLNGYQIEQTKNGLQAFRPTPATIRGEETQIIAWWRTRSAGELE